MGDYPIPHTIVGDYHFFPSGIELKYQKHPSFFFNLIYISCHCPCSFIVQPSHLTASTSGQPTLSVSLHLRSTSPRVTVLPSDSLWLQGDSNDSVHDSLWLVGEVDDSAWRLPLTRLEGRRFCLQWAWFWLKPSERTQQCSRQWCLTVANLVQVVMVVAQWCGSPWLAKMGLPVVSRVWKGWIAAFTIQRLF